MSIFSKIRSVFSNGALAKSLIIAAADEAKPTVEAAIKTKLTTAGFAVPDEVIEGLYSAVVDEISAKIK